ncbi:MAG: hypothetical protein HDR21_14010 [Lachnospiraceae bacterium]|nr:hypothetical protein [Lachnospiraceae bacterium]
MAWIQVHQTIKDHRKTYDASDALEIQPAHMLGLLVNFWLWALDNAPAGDLQGISNRTIARAAGWPEADADRFVESLEIAGWIDSTEDGNLVIHDWLDYAGKLIDQREAEKQRSRKRRAAAKADAVDDRPQINRRTTGGQPADDRQTTGGRLDQTRLDYTTPDKIKDNTPTPSDDAPKKQNIQEERFALFWSLYPKKVGKQAALKSWKRIKPDAELFERILSALEQARGSEQWQRERGRFIPNPTTWLNQGRWDDELEPAGNYQNTQRTGGKINTMGVLAEIYAEEDAHDQEGDNTDPGGNYLGIS